MSFVRKNWKNRISEYFNRYKLENAKTGEVFNAYINLNDGAVEEQGDRLNAEALNDLEGRIESAFNESGGGEVLIAGTEETSTSSQAYAIGQYLIYNQLLYKVTSAIAQGDTLTPNTNIKATKIADEVANHLVVNGTEFYFDYQNGEFGYNTSPLRGADTFSPFKRDVLPDTITFHRNQGTGAGVYWIPRAIVDQYSYYMISGASNGWVYDGTGYKAATLNAKKSISTLTPGSGSNGIGFGWSGNGTDTYCTLYKS